jgi:hypothetical protein
VDPLFKPQYLDSFQILTTSHLNLPLLPTTWSRPSQHDS